MGLSGERERAEGTVSEPQDWTERQLIVVTGKGGVGKSALSCVLGRTLAEQGRRVLLLEVDRRENLQQMLGVPPSAGEMLPVSEGLHLQNLKPNQVVDWVVEKKVKIRPIVQRVLSSAVYHRFVEGAPGLNELAILGHALRVVRGEVPGPTIDTVILDAPATGHGVSLLTAPRLVAEAIGHGPFAELAREVADFVADGRRVGMVVVTLAEEMPVSEALELRKRLEGEVGRAPDLLVVNGLYPEYDSRTQASDDLADLWRRRHRVNADELDRLSSSWQGPRVDLPLLPIDAGEPLVAELTGRFRERIDDLAGGAS